MLRHNSTIRIREKICVNCGRPCQWFSKKRCQQCAKVEDFYAREERELAKDEGLSELITRLDSLVSKWVRYSAVGLDGLVECYTSRKRFKPSELDAGHYISRNCMYLRFDLRNIRPQSRTDNRFKYGLQAEYGKRLEEDHPGITEILLEESKIIHRWSREELRQMILEYENKLKNLK